MSKLKPCPFCGGEAKIRGYRTFTERVHGIVDKYYIECKACHIETPISKNSEHIDDVLEYWNRRTTNE